MSYIFFGTLLCVKSLGPEKNFLVCIFLFTVSVSHIRHKQALYWVIGKIRCYKIQKNHKKHFTGFLLSATEMTDSLFKVSELFITSSSYYNYWQFLFHFQVNKSRQFPFYYCLKLYSCLCCALKSPWRHWLKVIIGCGCYSNRCSNFICGVAGSCKTNRPRGTETHLSRSIYLSGHCKIQHSAPRGSCCSLLDQDRGVRFTGWRGHWGILTAGQRGVSGIKGYVCVMSWHISNGKVCVCAWNEMIFLNRLWIFSDFESRQTHFGHMGALYHFVMDNNQKKD